MIVVVVICALHKRRGRREPFRLTAGAGDALDEVRGQVSKDVRGAGTRPREETQGLPCAW